MRAHKCTHLATSTHARGRLLTPLRFVCARVRVLRVRVRCVLIAVRRRVRARECGSMRAPTWRLEPAGEGEGGGGGGEWRAAERGTRVRDWGGGGRAGGLGSVDGGALEGGVWHHVGVVETDHLGVVGWSLWFDAPALLRRHIHILARIRPPRPPSHSDWLRAGREPGYV